VTRPGPARLGRGPRLGPASPRGPGAPGAGVLVGAGRGWSSAGAGAGPGATPAGARRRPRPGPALVPAGPAPLSPPFSDAVCATISPRYFPIKWVSTTARTSAREPRAGIVPLSGAIPAPRPAGEPFRPAPEPFRTPCTGGSGVAGPAAEMTLPRPGYAGRKRWQRNDPVAPRPVAGGSPTRAAPGAATGGRAPRPSHRPGRGTIGGTRTGARIGPADDRPLGRSRSRGNRRFGERYGIWRAGPCPTVGSPGGAGALRFFGRRGLHRRAGYDHRFSRENITRQSR
jgi:hypothetical protein